jgi:hypothetical protein
METKKHASEADLLRGAMNFASRVIRRMAANQEVNTSMALRMMRERRHMKKLLAGFVLVLLLVPLAPARTTSSAHTRSTPKAGVAKPKSRSIASHTRSTKCTTCTRDSNGRIKRNKVAADSFRRSYPCPSTAKASSACPGYVIDHVVPLKRGGADTRSGRPRRRRGRKTGQTDSD